LDLRLKGYGRPIEGDIVYYGSFRFSGAWRIAVALAEAAGAVRAQRAPGLRACRPAKNRGKQETSGRLPDPSSKDSQLL